MLTKELKELFLVTIYLAPQQQLVSPSNCFLFPHLIFDVSPFPFSLTSFLFLLTNETPGILSNSAFTLKQQMRGCTPTCCPYLYSRNTQKDPLYLFKGKRSFVPGKNIVSKGLNLNPGLRNCYIFRQSTQASSYLTPIVSPLSSSRD